MGKINKQGQKKYVTATVDNPYKTDNFDSLKSYTNIDLENDLKKNEPGNLILSLYDISELHQKQFREKLSLWDRFLGRDIFGPLEICTTHFQIYEIYKFKDVWEGLAPNWMRDSGLGTLRPPQTRGSYDWKTVIDIIHNEKES